ncbi:MAG TPA: efflux RND transporter periplasmic adaptor subunit [Casimicrobiaceae bacterium]
MYLWLGTRAPPVQYTSARIGSGPVERIVSTSGTVNPVLTVIVGSYVSGVIVGQYCDYNTQVKKDQLCAQIDPRPYQMAVDQSKAELATARAQLDKDRANLVNQEILYTRNAGLLSRGIVSQETLDNAKGAYDQAKAQVALDQATIEQRSAALKAAQINLDYTQIRSPVSGTVVSRNITIGQTVAASFQTPTLFLIATDLTKMQVDANVSESDIGGIKEGDSATFTVEAYPGRPFAGTVAQVRQAPQSVQNVVTYDVVVAVDNDRLLLRPGMTATARIVIAKRSNVLRVPDQALRYTPAGSPRAKAGSQVWVLRGGAPLAVAVKLGLDDDSYSEVLEGDLHDGDSVVTGEVAPQRSAAPGAPRFFGR